MRKIIYSYVIWICLGITSLQAQSVDSLFAIAKEHNPMLKEKALQIEMLAERKVMMSSMPDPSVSAMIMLRPMETSFGDQRFVFTASQMMPWFGSLKLAAKVENIRAQAAYYDYLDAAATLYSELRMSYAEIAAEQLLLENMLRNIELMQRMLEITERRIKSGEGGASMLLQTQIAIEEMEVDAENARVKITQMKRSLILLIAQSDLETIEIATELDLPEFEIDYGPKDGHISLQRIQSLQKANEEEQSLVKKNGLPNLEFGLQYDPRFMNQSGPIDALMPMVGMSLPIYRKKYKAQQKEKALEAEMLESNLYNRQLQLSNAWEEARYQMIESKNRLALFSKNRARTQRILDLEMRKYASDGENFDEIIRIQSLLLDLVKKEILAKLQANKAYIQMEYLTHSYK